MVNIYIYIHNGYYISIPIAPIAKISGGVGCFVGMLSELTPTSMAFEGDELEIFRSEIHES